VHPELRGRASPHVNISKVKQSGETCAKVSKTPYRLTSTTRSLLNDEKSFDF